MSYTYIPEEDFNSILKYFINVFEMKCFMNEEQGLYECLQHREHFDQMPNLYIDLYDGQDRDNIVNLTFSKNTYVLKNYFKNNQLMILPENNATNNNEWRIGLNIMSEMYTVFDYENKRIGIGKSDPKVATINKSSL